MKKYIIRLSLLLALASSLGACSKFLDIQPVGKVIPTTLSEYRSLFDKAYLTTYIDRGLTELRTDIASVQDEKNSLNFYNDIQLWRDANPSLGTTAWGWATYYESLFYANSIIHDADKISGGTSDEVSQLVGEAYLMRALLHFNLVNLYGQPYTKAGAEATLAVPLKLDLDLENSPQRATVGAVYRSILSDIAEAQARLKQESWISGTGDNANRDNTYRFSKLSASALEARVHLYMAEWSKALEVAEQVLSKHPTLADLNSSGATLPNLYNSVETITAYEQVYNTDLAAATRVSASFVSSYLAGDLRPALYFGEQVSGTETYRLSKNDGSSKFRLSFRSAEYYLIASEAALETKQLPLAKTRLLTLLKARYTPEAYTAREQAIQAMDEATFRTELWTERRRELAFEGHYWFDLRRSTRPSITKRVSGSEYTLSADDARYTLPIPKEAISSNPNLSN